MKVLSYDAVKTVAEFLILTFGKTTTLDVKGNLRRLGFVATQKEVSDFMEEIYEDYEAGYNEYFFSGKFQTLTYENKTEAGRTFRVYSFKDEESIDEDDCDGCDGCSCETDAPKDPVSVTPVTTPITTKDPRQYIKDNMKVSSYTLSKALGISEASVRAYKAAINRQ